jgi:multiple sugar transport system substrate-binding protein
MNKAGLIFFAFCAVTALLSGCRTEPIPSPTPTPTIANTVEPSNPILNILVSGGPDDEAVYRQLIDEFTVAHPEYTIGLTVIRPSEYIDYLNQNLTSETLADVFTVDGANLPDLSSRYLTYDLQNWINSDNINLSNYIPKTMQCFQLRRGIFALPSHFTMTALYYNRDLFDKANLPYPDDTWTWETLIDAAKKLTVDVDKDGLIDQYGFWADLSDMESLWGPVIWQSGGEIIDEGYTTTLLDQPAALNGWQLIHDMIFKHKIMPKPEAVIDNGDLFLEGKAAMTTAGNQMIPAYNQAAFKWDIAPLPKVNQPVTILNTTGFAIARHTKYPKQAWQLLKYLVDRPSQEIIAAQNIGLPALETVLSGSDMQAAGKSFDAQVFLDSLVAARVKPCFIFYRPWSKQIAEGMDPVWNGLAELQPTLQQIIPKANSILIGQKY